jgi:hypothetical protein
MTSSVAAPLFVMVTTKENSRFFNNTVFSQIIVYICDSKHWYSCNTPLSAVIIRIQQTFANNPVLPTSPSARRENGRRITSCILLLALWRHRRTQVVNNTERKIMLQ